MSSTLAFGERQVGEGQPAFVLAEVASAHQGEANQALSLAHTAKNANADGVKFQLFRASELVPPNDPQSSTFKKIELSLEQWENVIGEASGLALPIIADVFDQASLFLGEKLPIAGYKIHSTDMENPEFIRKVAATGKPLLLSTGGCGLGRIEAAIALAREEGNEHLMLLHGIQNFPTKTEESHLLYLRTLKSTFGYPVGFLDHVDGNSHFATVLPALAVAFGADLVEKHMTLDRSAKGFDYESALEEKAFRAMVELIREAEKSFGDTSVPVGARAERYHRTMRRAILSGELLEKGVPIRKEQLAFLRSETGIAPFESGRLVGRRPRRDIAAFEPLTEDLFE